MPGNQPNIVDWYHLMDVVLLTSRHEGLPNVLLEAASLGIPVVVPKVGGAPEVLIDGVTGYAVPNADAAALAARILNCLDNVNWRTEARERAPRFVRETFSIPTMVKRTLEEYGLAG
jgi:glycosyltransferase involved in cell wall biosynthesis